MQARVHSSERAVGVTSCSRGGFALLVAVVLLLPVAGLAQAPETPTLVTLPHEAAAARTAAHETYVARVIGNDVRIRSGPGTNFYQCGKLYADDRVQVVRSQQGWSCIVPLPGCFSWISMQYVSINLQDPTRGIVTGDNVGVYAGSDTEEAKHSTSKQVVLNRGQTVKLLGEEKDDYYKIAPPPGAYLWVSSQYLELADKSLLKTPPAEVKGTAQTAAGKSPGDPNAAPTLAGLDLYYAVSEKVKAEHGKPITEQDYTELKKKLAELAAVQDGSRAARFAEFTLKQVEGYELACQVAKELELQNKQLQKTTEKIDQARTTKLEQIEDRSKFAVMGRLETSSVYDGAGQARRYRVLDESGKTICYVMPVGSAVNVDFSRFIGRKVGLVGNIEPHEATQRAFIEFSEIVPLDSDN